MVKCECGLYLRISFFFLPMHTVFGRGYAHTYYICAQMQMCGGLSYMATYDSHMMVYMTVGYICMRTHIDRRKVACMYLHDCRYMHADAYSRGGCSEVRIHTRYAHL